MSMIISGGQRGCSECVHVVRTRFNGPFLTWTLSTNFQVELEKCQLATSRGHLRPLDQVFPLRGSSSSSAAAISVEW